MKKIFFIIGLFFIFTACASGQRQTIEEPRNGQPNPEKQTGDRVINLSESYRYVVEDKNVYYVYGGTEKVKLDLDPETFEILNYGVFGYVKDKNKVYYCENGAKELLDADASTFRSLECGSYGMDKNNIYRGGYNVTKEFDYDSFACVGGPVVKDKNNLFVNGFKYDLGQEIKDKSVVKRSEVDLSTLVGVGDGTFSAYYIKDKNNVYLVAKTLLLRTDFDSATFQIIDKEYSKDKNHVYENGEILEGLDPATFDPAKFNYDEYSALLKRQKIGGDYTKDDKNVYYGYTIIKEVDVKTFKFIERSLAVDKNHAYYRNEIIKDVDAASFQVVGPYFAKDYNYVYIEDPFGPYSKILNSDAKTFQILEGGFAKDKNQVYKYGYGGGGPWVDVHDKKDPKTFQTLNDDYSKDKNGVYHCYYTSRGFCDDEVISNIDLKTFRLIKNGPFAKDKNYVYKDAVKLENVDPGTFQVFYVGKLADTRDLIGYIYIYYSQDKNDIYFASSEFGGDSAGWQFGDFYKIEDADQKTFKNLKDGYAKDKNHVYQYGKILEGVDPVTFGPETYKP